MSHDEHIQTAPDSKQIDSICVFSVPHLDPYRLPAGHPWQYQSPVLCTPHWQRSGPTCGPQWSPISLLGALPRGPHPTWGLLSDVQAVQDSREYKWVIDWQLWGSIYSKKGVYLLILPQLDAGPVVVRRTYEKTGVLLRIWPQHVSRSCKGWGYGGLTAEHGTLIGCSRCQDSELSLPKIPSSLPWRSV